MAETPNVASVAPITPVTPETPAEGAAKAVAEASVKPSAPTSKERMYTVKIDGKEEQWPESKVIERAQKGTAAEKDMAEAAQYRQAFANFVAQSKDPTKMLELMRNPKALGYSEENQVALMQAMLSSKNPAMVQAIKKWLWENEVEPSTLTEDQRKMRELEGFKTETEKKDSERKRLEDEENHRTETERHLKEYKLKIWEGIQAHKLPQTELMVARVARKVQLMRKAGMAADFPKACEYVKADLINEYNEHLGKATDQDILNLLPDGVAERINKAYLAKLRGVEQPKIEGNPPAKKQKRDKESKENLAQQLRAMERGQKVW